MPKLMFDGSERTRGECEALALRRIDPAIREREADLFSTKWFDCRLLHPVHATYLYAHEYKVAARNYCRMNNDAERAPHLKIFSSLDVFQTRDLTSCVNARQGLDRIGCRYDWALGWMLKRQSDRGWLSFPRPNQLYSEELMLDVADAWKAECAVVLQIARSDHFRIVHGAALQPVQGEYVEWLLGQVRGRGIDAWRPLSRLLSEGVISAQIIAEHFDMATLQRAMKVSALAG